MDKVQHPAQRNWHWMRDAMPRVAALVAEKRKTWGNAHCNECWRRGVEACEPGWFFAREGALAVGVPWGDAAVQALQAPATTDTLAGGLPVRAVLVMREPSAVEAASAA